MMNGYYGILVVGLVEGICRMDLLGFMGLDVKYFVCV